MESIKNVCLKFTRKKTSDILGNFSLRRFVHETIKFLRNENVILFSQIKYGYAKDSMSLEFF